MKFKKVTTRKQALQDPRVDNCYSEYGNFESGKNDWWIELKSGYICKNMECGTIHEQTLKVALNLLNNNVVTEEEYYSK